MRKETTATDNRNMGVEYWPLPEVEISREIAEGLDGWIRTPNPHRELFGRRLEAGFRMMSDWAYED
jgi:hypothetical protein